MQQTLSLEPSNSKFVDSIYCTTDYSMFKKIKGNRPENRLHVELLKKSMQENQLIVPIIVNENYEIIDGQHRFSSISQLGLPLYYIKCSGYSLKEVHRLNAKSKNWNLDDFLNGYISMGLSDYKKIKRLITKYNIKISFAIELTKGEVPTIRATENFKDGVYKIMNYDEPVAFLQCLELFNKFSAYKSIKFMKAFRYLYNSPKYNHETMIKRLKYGLGLLELRSKEEQYLELLSDIYNKGMKMEHRIYFDGIKEITNNLISNDQ
ncbi:ParB N-terminal domain-containing protein [Bacillus anthracis]|uniref:ParB N-terminal domain-containing protein n=1 Tax=Bacillus anthracis TaxID=1392 RepID=UPI003D1EFD76